jgi:hypothetical protein
MLLIRFSNLHNRPKGPFYTTAPDWQIGCRKQIKERREVMTFAPRGVRR